MSLDDAIEEKLKGQIDKTQIDCYRTEENEVACQVSREDSKHAIEVKHWKEDD